MVFNIFEERIIKVLGRYRRALTINEISNTGNISWVTTKQYLYKLYNRGVVRKKTIIERKYWRLNI